MAELYALTQLESSQSTAIVLFKDGWNGKSPRAVKIESAAKGGAMIRQCTDADISTIDSIINQAANAYRGVIPADCWREPYMSRPALLAEIASGVNFWGWDESGVLTGVMGLQNVRDATLIRHAYVSPEHQGRGVGGALLAALADRAATRLLVGTWAAADWAIRFYQQHGFRMVSTEEKDRLLSTYWKIPSRQQETSVVLLRTS